MGNRKKDRIRLIVVKNPFNMEEREQYSLVYYKNKTVNDYILKYSFGIETLVVSVNGHILTEEEVKTKKLNAYDCIAICDSVEKGGGGGGKDIFRALAGIALSMWVGGLGETGIWGVKAGTFAMGLVQTGLMLIGGALINAIFPVASASDSGNTNNESSTDNTYKWGQLSSIQGQGGAVARTYGTIRTAGTLIASHITTSGDKQYLNLLYTGGRGVASGISNIQIDGNPIENYVDVQYETKLGTNTQSPVSFFDYTSSDQQLNYALELGEWHTQRTEGDGGEGLEVMIAFSNGLYYITDGGSKAATSVAFDLQYRKVGDTNWTSYGTSYTTVQKYRNTVTGEHYELGDTRVYSNRIEYWVSTNEVIGREDGQDIYREQLVEKINVSVYQGDFVTISACYESTQYITYRMDYLPKGQYDVRVRCRSKAGTTSRFVNTFYFASLSHILYQRYCRPNKILVAIRALATDQLSGSEPTITWEQTVNSVLVFNPSTNSYEEKPANNPAWVVYDMFHGAQRLESPISLGTYVYVVNGCSASRLDYYSYSAWAARCEAMNLTFNYCFDSIADMWDAIQKVETCGRGKVVIKGTTISCVFDEPKTPTQMFTVANVIQDTFTESFLSQDSRANSVEVTFANKEKNYDSDVAVAYSSNWDAEKDNPTQVTLYGCTNYAEAYRYACYLLRANQYFIRTLSFQADVDAIACQVGDAIYLQSDVFNWGAGGRLVEFTNSTITLNEPIILEEGKSYTLKVRYQDGTLLDKECAPITETKVYDTITLASPFSVMPEKYDVYSFGETSKTLKKVRVTGISRSSDSRKKITCVEFNDAVYNENTVIEVPEVVTTPTIVFTSLNAVEDGYRQQDGTHICSLTMSWNVTNLYRTEYRTEVQLLKDDGNYATIESTPDIIYNVVKEGLVVGSTYKFRIRALSRIGVPLTTWSYSQVVTIVGKDSPPPNVSSVTSSLLTTDRSTVLLSWSPVSVVDLAGYRLFMDNVVIADLIKVLNYNYIASDEISHTFSVVAVDNSGNESAVRAETTITPIVTPNNVTNLLTTIDETDRRKINISWDVVTDSDISGYEVSVNGTVVSPIIQANSYIYTATIDSAKTIVIKTVSVKGIRSTGTTTTATPFVTPTSVAGISIFYSVSNKNYVTLSWNAVSDSDLAQYEVRLGDVWETSTLLGKVKTTSINYNVQTTGVYKFFVATINNAGNYSTPTSYSATLTCEPSNVFNFSSSQDSTNRTNIFLSWDAIVDTDLAQYEIRVGNSWSDSSLVQKTKTTKTTFTVPSSGTYHFMIKAINNAGFYSSAISEITSTVTCEPSAVTGLSCNSSSLDKTVLVLTWNPVTDSDISQYEVRLGTVWETASLVEKTKSSTCNYKASADGTYTFIVKSITIAGYYSEESSVVKSLVCAPSNVSSITAVQETTDSTLIDLTWSTITDSDLAQYEVRLGSNWSTGTVLGKTKSLGLKYSVPSSGTYVFKVKAINNAGFYSVTEASRTVTFTCEPSSVSGLTVTQEPTDKTLLKLSWNPVSTTDLAQYELRMGSTWGASTLIEQIKTCSTSYRVPSSGTYNFLIKAINNAGIYSITADSESIVAVCEPSTVSGLSFTQNSSNRSIIDIAWNSITDNDLANYEIRVGTSWVTGTLVERTKSTKTSYTVPSTGSYTIWAYSVNNAGFYSTPVSVTNTVNCEPSVVANITHVQDSVNKKMLNLYWDASSGSDILLYEIARDNVVVGTTKDTSYRDTLSASGTYSYSVRAKTVAGYYSSKIYHSATVSIEPYEVTNLTASQLISDHAKVRLSWDSVDISDLSHYTIKEGSTWDTATIVNDHAVGNYLDITITEEKTYTWWIKAVSTNGTSSPNATSFSSIFSMNPTAPTYFSATTDSENRANATISWTGIADLDLLEYEVRYGGTGWSNATTIAKTRETRVSWNPPTSGSYTLRLLARNTSLFESDEVNFAYTAKIEPSNVTNFIASQNGDNVLLTWSKVDDVDVVGYEVREGATFSNGQLVATGITGTTLQFAVDTELSHRYHVKAINRAGKYSQESTYASVTVTNLTPKNVISSSDEITLQTGTKTNVEFGESNITFATLGGGFNDYPDTKFSDIGGETVLKLLSTNVVYDYHFNNAIDLNKWKSYGSANVNLTKNSSGNLSIVFNSTATSGIVYVLGSTLERGATYVCEFKWRSNKTGTSSGFLISTGVWGGTIVPTSYTLANTAGEWKTDIKEFTMLSYGTDPVSFLMGYGGKVAGDYIEIEYLKIYKKSGYYPSSGVYQSTVKDMGQIITANISCEYQPSILYSAGTSAILEYSISKDNIVWDAWKPFIPVQATFRYVQIRVTLTTDDTAMSPEVNRLILKIDVPDKDCVGNATIEAGGTAVNYNYTYWELPFVSPVATESGKRAELVSRTNSSFTVKVLNALTGTDVGGSIMWHSKGY